MDSHRNHHNWIFIVRFSNHYFVTGLNKISLQGEYRDLRYPRVFAWTTKHKRVAYSGIPHLHWQSLKFGNIKKYWGSLLNTSCLQEQGLLTMLDVVTRPKFLRHMLKNKVNAFGGVIRSPLKILKGNGGSLFWQRKCKRKFRYNEKKAKK